jgi:hypothetical protein
MHWSTSVAVQVIPECVIFLNYFVLWFGLFGCIVPDKGVLPSGFIKTLYVDGMSSTGLGDGLENVTGMAWHPLDQTSEGTYLLGEGEKRGISL